MLTSDMFRKSNTKTAIQLFKHSTSVIFVSLRNLEVAERQLCQKLINAKVLSNPVNLNNPNILDYPESNIINFGIVASLTCSHKGQDFLFQILSSEKWLNRNWILNLYGIGPDENYLKQLALYYQIHDRVFFYGHIDDIESVWLKNHIFLLPSLGEGTPLALVEASLSGRPAVVTDVGGNETITIDNETGFLCSAPTVKLFDDTLERAWNNKHEWKEMGEKAFYNAINKIDLTPDKTLLELLTN